MKALIIATLTILCAVVLFRSTKLDFLDLNGDKFPISWDDITDDLWP